MKVTIQAAAAALSFSWNDLAETDTFHTRVLKAGERVDLFLDKASAAAFGSKSNYIFGSNGMGIKVVRGNSAGTVTAYYLSSKGGQHDEMDLKFLGSEAGKPIILQTNDMIVFYVDTTPFRVYKNNEDLGVPYPNSQGVGIYASLWDGTWATDGGRVGLGWNAAPFTASFQGFGLDSCEVQVDVNACKYGNQWWQGAAYKDPKANQCSTLMYKLSYYRSKRLVKRCFGWSSCLALLQCDASSPLWRCKALG